jgi:hypothetical protein
MGDTADPSGSLSLCNSQSGDCHPHTGPEPPIIEGGMCLGAQHVLGAKHLPSTKGIPRDYITEVLGDPWVVCYKGEKTTNALASRSMCSIRFVLFQGAGEVACMQARRLEFDAQHPHKKSGMVACIVIPGLGRPRPEDPGSSLDS